MGRPVADTHKSGSDAHRGGERYSGGSKPEMQFENPPNETFDLESWLRRVADLAAKEASAKAVNYQKEGTVHIPASVTVNFTDNARAVNEGGSVSITSARYEGTVERKIEEIPSITKASYKRGNPQPLAGCAISDFGRLRTRRIDRFQPTNNRACPCSGE